MANEQDLATLDGITSAGLIADASGNLYGTTDSGGADGDGSVFEIARDPTSPTATAAPRPPSPRSTAPATARALSPA